MSVRVRKPNRNRAPASQPSRKDQDEAADHKQSVLVEQSAFWQGPLPPPAVLDDFRRLVPDAPERIFLQWEQESSHRRSYEQKALDAAIRRDERGQLSAISFALTALSVSAFALWMHEPWVAGTIGGGTVISVVGAFLYQRVGKASKSIAQPPSRR